MRGTKLHGCYPVSPCPPTGGQGGTETQISAPPGKKGEVCLLAEEHALCCMLAIAPFVYMVTHIYAATLCSLDQGDRPADQIFVSYELICFCLLQATPVIIVTAQCSGCCNPF